MSTENTKKNLVVIVGHPDNNSLNANLAQQFVTAQKHQHLNVTTYNAYDFDLIKQNPLKNGYGTQFDKACDDMVKADYIAIFCPMWNFGMPGGLKNFLDGVVQARKFFRFSQYGIPYGLLTTKKLTVFWTSDTNGWLLNLLCMNYTSTHIKKIFKLCGVKNFDIINFSPVRKADTNKINSWFTKVKNYKF